MGSLQEFCLRWNNHSSTLTSIFADVFQSELFYDCTLVAEGRCIEAHRILLSACSQYFKDVLSHSQYKKKDPIIILKDVTFRELTALVDYMYKGEVTIRENELQSILKVAEGLQIKGLSDPGEKALANTEESRPLKRTVQQPSSTATNSGFATEHRRSSYQSDHYASDSPRQVSEPSAPAKRMRRRRPSNEESGLGQTLPPQESLPVPSDVSQPIVSHQLSPLPAPTVIPISTSTPIASDQILPEPVADATPKTELIEPKHEIEDTNDSNNFEDLTLDDDDDDDSMNMDNSQPGPSMGSDTSSNQGVMPWQLGGDMSGNQNLVAQDTTAGSQGLGLWFNEKSRHSDENQTPSYKCKNCDKSFKHRNNLSRHVSVECGKEPRWCCSFCTFRTKYRFNLNTHMRTKHDA